MGTPAATASAIDSDGTAWSLIAAVRDVTERKKLEHQAELWRKARAEVRERDEFLSIASHELRTPVTALQLQLQLLLRATQRSVEDLPKLLEGKVDGLERQTRRILGPGERAPPPESAARLDRRPSRGGRSLA